MNNITNATQPRRAEDLVRGWTIKTTVGLNDTCGICNEKYQEGEEKEDPVILPGCSHIYGSTCMTEWLRNHNSCPMCRQEILKPRDNLVRRAGLHDHLHRNRPDYDPVHPDPLGGPHGVLRRGAISGPVHLQYRATVSRTRDTVRTGNQRPSNGVANEAHGRTGVSGNTNYQAPLSDMRAEPIDAQAVDRARLPADIATNNQHPNNEGAANEAYGEADTSSTTNARADVSNVPAGLAEAQAEDRARLPADIEAAQSGGTGGAQANPDLPAASVEQAEDRPITAADIAAVRRFFGQMRQRYAAAHGTGQEVDGWALAREVRAAREMLDGNIPIPSVEQADAEDAEMTDAENQSPASDIATAAPTPARVPANRTEPAPQGSRNKPNSVGGEQNLNSDFEVTFLKRVRDDLQEWYHDRNFWPEYANSVVTENHSHGEALYSDLCEAIVCYMEDDTDPADWLYNRWPLAEILQYRSFGSFHRQIALGADSDLHQIIDRLRTIPRTRVNIQLLDDHVRGQAFTFEYTRPPNGYLWTRFLTWHRRIQDAHDAYLATARRQYEVAAEHGVVPR